MRNPFRLTKREKQILDLVNEGLNAQQIAAHLGISYTSVGVMSSIAAQKEQCSRFPDVRKSYGTSSLAAARGAKRMKGTR